MLLYFVWTTPLYGYAPVYHEALGIRISVGKVESLVGTGAMVNVDGTTLTVTMYMTGRGIMG
jgi:hypothetical protein